MKPMLALAVTLLALLAFVGSPVRTASAGTGICPENTAPPNPADPSMVLNQPVEGATVSNPVTVSGQARVFEAVVSIDIYDANGNTLAHTTTLATPAGPTLSPFSASVPFTTPSTQKGCVRVFEASAKDGSPVNIVQHEVNFGAPVSSLPSTGMGSTAGPQSSETRDWLFGAAGVLSVITLSALILRSRG